MGALTLPSLNIVFSVRSSSLCPQCLLECLAQSMCSKFVGRKVNGRILLLCIGPSICDMNASIPRLGCVPPGSDFSTSSSVAGGCALWFVYLAYLASRPGAQTAKHTHSWGVSCNDAEPPCLGTSVADSTPAGIVLRPRSLLAPPDVGITGLDIKPTRVRARRWELGWEARAPLPHPLYIWVAAL